MFHVLLAAMVPAGAQEGPLGPQSEAAPPRPRFALATGVGDVYGWLGVSVAYFLRPGVGGSWAVGADELNRALQFGVGYTWRR